MNQSSAEIIPFGKSPHHVQRVAPREARIIARTQQWRVAAADRAAPALHALRSQLNKIDTELHRLLREVLDLEEEVRVGQKNRFMPPFTKRTYGLLIGAMLVLEWPVNKAALDFLRLPELGSYALAMFFALVNFVAAKCSARVFRQEPFAAGGWRSWAMAAVTNSALLATIFLVGQLRSLEAHQENSAMTFFGLQLAFYFGTLFLSYQVIPPSSEAEQLNLRRDFTAAKLARLWGRRANIAKVHNRELERVRLRLIDLEEDAQERVAEYRDSNMRFRTGGSLSWQHQSIGPNVWRPLDLDHPVDEHPATIGALIELASEGEQP